MRHLVPPKIIKALDEILDMIDNDPDKEFDKHIHKDAKAIDRWLAGVAKEKKDRAFELEALRERARMMTRLLN